MDPQAVCGGRHQRARGQRVWRDEGDHEALHAPGHHGAAVGEVVAGGASGRGDHEPVAAHAADDLVIERQSDLGDALAHLAVNRDVVDRQARVRGELACRCPVRPGLRVPVVVLEDDRGQPQELEVALQGPPHTLLDLARLDRRQEADFAKVDREHRHPHARVALQCAQDRAVAAEHQAELDIVGHRGVREHARARRQAVLARLLLIEAQRHAGVGRELGEPAQRLGGVVHAPVREHRHLPHGLDLGFRGLSR